MGFTWHINPNTLTDFQKDYIILTEGDEEISWNDFYTCIDNCTYDTSLIGKYFS